MNPVIHIICVNYKNNEQTSGFIRNVFELNGFENCKIWLVNNSAKNVADSSFKDLVDLAPHNLLVINAPDNLGYFGAARAAFEQIKNLPYEWVIISNTDMQIKDKDLLIKLMDFKRQSDWVVLAPSIISSLTGQESNPLMLTRPLKLRMHFYKWIFALSWLSHIYHVLAVLKSKIKNSFTCPMPNQNQAQPKPKPKPKPQCIYAPHGAAIIFHSEYFKNGGSFAHNAFLYCEEFSVSEMVRKMNKKIVFSPQLQFFHQERGSTGLFYSSQVLAFKKEANRYIADTYFK